MIPQETVNTILETARIEDVVGDFLTLKRRGANFVACCPFHEEKTPSFYVSPVKGLYKCFGCGKSGSAVGFVMEHEHCDYPEALRYLAAKYHIEIVEAEQSAEELAARQRRESLLIVSKFAQEFYSSQLQSGEGRDVGYAYFRSRALTDETIGNFGLGWAPSSKSALTDAATKAGYKMEYLVAAGLTVQKEDGSYADKFRERVMFPIHSVSGRVVAFSGRTLRSDNPAKYVNTAETEIYVKSRNLLGIYHAKAEISRKDCCLLVEGNVDMVMLHQLGIRNAVASCGTSLTVEQIRLIHKFTDNVTIMYDGDSAGIHAAIRGLNLVLREGLNVRIVLLPDGEDPDSFARKHTLEEVQDFISENQRDFISFKADLLAEDAGKDPLKRANLINDIADTIANIPDAVKRSVYVDDCAVKFGLDSQVLFDRVRNTLLKIREDEAKEKERNERYVENGLPVPGREEQVPVTREYESSPMTPVEKELLRFILLYGRETLNFPSDSKFYRGEGNEVTVAEFIRDALAPDNAEFSHPLYWGAYVEYMKMYDSGLPQERILRTLLDSPDREMAGVVSELSVEKYQLTVESFEKSLMTKESWLVNFVPQTIIKYNECRVQFRMDEIRRSLSSMDGEEQMNAMKELISLQNLQKEIKKLYDKRI